MTNTIAPRVIAVAMSTACTQKKLVGALDQASPDQARSSATMARAKRGQMTMLNTPARMSDHADRLEITAPLQHIRLDRRTTAPRPCVGVRSAGPSTVVDARGILVRMAELVVLLRAVNVGGATLPMARLRDIASDLGATDVSTHIASGNLLCTPPGDVAEFSRALEGRIEAEFGFFREAITRTPAELRSALAAYPFPDVEPKLAHVHFLAAEPPAGAVETLAAADHPERLKLIGRDLHIAFVNGVAGSKLTAPLLTRRLESPGTARNLRTIAALIEKARS